MTAAFWLSTGRKIATVLIGTVLGAGALYALYHLARFLLAATAEERAWTGITVAFIAAVGFGYWISCRMVDFVHAARELLLHMEGGAQFANRAALDARAMLEEVRDESAILREWWHAHSGQPETPTEPMRRIGTDTVESARVIDEGMDEFLADTRKRWDEIAAAPVEKPIAKARRSQV